VADTLKALYERKAKHAGEIKRQADLVNAENRDFKPEERAAWDQANKDYDQVCAQIKVAERAAQVEADERARQEKDRQIGRDDFGDEESRRRQQPGTDGASITEETRALALNAWCRHQLGHQLTDGMEDACKQLRFNPGVQALNLPLFETRSFQQAQQGFRTFNRASPQLRQHFQAATAERRTLSAIAGPAGAYTIVPMDLIRNLEINMLYYGGMLQVSEIIRTATGEPMLWPTADNTSIKGRRINQNTQVDLANAVTADPIFGAVQWQAWKYTSDAILVPYELLEDSVFNLPSVLGEMLGERLGRIQNTEFTTGTGASQPYGITVVAPVGVTTAVNNAIAADELIDTVHSVDVAYRTPDAGFMFHDSTIKAIRKLKDGQGQYLWQAGLQQGRPDSLLSYTLTTNNDLAAIAASAVVGVFGQLSKYKVRQVNNVRLYRLQERFRDNDQDGFVAFVRADGNLLQAGTAPVKTLKMHS